MNASPEYQIHTPIPSVPCRGARIGGGGATLSNPAAATALLKQNYAWVMTKPEQKLKPPIKSKYNAKPTAVDGVLFPSKKEAARWGQLQLLERAGEIRNLKRQVVIKLAAGAVPILSRSGRQMRLTVDFSYEDKRLGWAVVYEEAKGKRTRDYDVRLAVVQAMGYKVTET